MNTLTFKQRLFIFLQVEDAPKWKQNLAVALAVGVVLIVLCAVSLLGGLATGTPSGNNIPWV